MSKRRENGAGTLVSKGKGKPWLARWMFNGKVYTRSTGKTNKAEALKELAKFVAPYQEESKIAVLNNLVAKAKSAEETRTSTIEDKRIPIADAYEKFENDIATSDIAENTKTTYSMYFSGFEKFIEKKHPEAKYMNDVTEDIAREYLEAERLAVGANVWNFKLLFLRRIWRVLGKDSGAANVWEAFEKRKVDKGTSRRELTPEELAKISETVKDDDEMTLLFALGVYTGLRKGDCCNIRWSNVDLIRHLVVVVPEKTKRHMSAPLQIPMHRVLFGLLMARKTKAETEKLEDGGYVLPSLCYERTSRKAAADRISRVFGKCGIVTFTKDANGRRKLVAGFHSLRHTFVSLNINGGMNPMLVQKIVGHSTVDMTEHYFHTNRKAIEDGIAKMPDVLKLEGPGVVEAEFVETVSVNLDRDIYELLMERCKGKDVNEVLRTMLKPEEVKVIEATAA